MPDQLYGLAGGGRSIWKPVTQNIQPFGMFQPQAPSLDDQIRGALQPYGIVPYDPILNFGALNMGHYGVLKLGNRTYIYDTNTVNPQSLERILGPLHMKTDIGSFGDAAAGERQKSLEHAYSDVSGGQDPMSYRNTQIFPDLIKMLNKQDDNRMQQKQFTDFLSLLRR